MRVRLIDVAFGFPDQSLLFDRLSTEVVGGQIAAITGPSGSGKSTLLSLLADWEKPSSGTIEITGLTRRNWIFQNPYGTASRSAVDHVRLPFLARGLSVGDSEIRARSLLKDVGLSQSSDVLFKALSGGQAQRLMLARALATDANLLLVDEPTAQLDAPNAHLVLDALSAVAIKDRVVFVATHDKRVQEIAHITLNLER